MNVLLHYLNTVLVLALMSTGLNLTAGTGGLLNLGHAALVGIGAYGAVLLVMRAGWPWLAAYLGGAVVAALVGGVLGAVTRRLRGDYFGLTTLGFGVVVHAVFTNWVAVTRGPMGIPGVPAPSLFGLVLRHPAQQALYGLVVLALTLAALRRLVASPWGWALRAVRDDEHAAAALGKPVTALRIQAMTISAFVAGLAGATQAFYIRYVDPTQFGLHLLVYALVVVIFGGPGNYWGPLLGSAVFVGLQQGLPYLGLPPSLAGPGQQALLSLALIALVLFRPRGLLPEPRAAMPRRGGAGHG